MLYAKPVQEAVAAGYSLDEIKGAAVSEYNDLLSAGFSKKEAQDYLSSTYNLKPATTLEDLNDSQYVASLMFMPLQKPADAVTNIPEAAMAGWQSSTAGLMLRGKAPQLSLTQDAPIEQKVVSAITQGLGDIPTMVLGGLFGGLAGGAAAAPTGPGAVAGAAMGAGAGAMGVTEYVRSALMRSYMQGQSTNWQEFAQRTINNFTALGKGAVIGGIAGGVGPATGQLVAKGVAEAVAPQFVKPVTTGLTLAAEVAALGTTMPMMEGHLPKADDFIVAGLTLGGMKAASLYTKKAIQDFVLDGVTPEQAIKLSLIDPEARERVAAVNQRVIAAETSKRVSVFTPLSPRDMKSRGFDIPETRAKKFSEEELDTMAVEHPITPKDYAGKWLTTSVRKAEREISQLGDGIETDITPITPDGTLPPDITTKRAAVGEIWLPKNAAYIEWKGNKDTVLAKVMREYMASDTGRADLESRSPGFFQENPNWWERFATVADERLVPQARKMFEEPSEAFIDFMRTNEWSPDMIKALTGGFIKTRPNVLKQSVPWRGIRRTDAQGTRYYIFDEKQIKPAVKPGNVEPTAYDLAREDVNKVVSINERTATKLSDIWDNTMKHLVDVFAPLNKAAEPGKLSESYLQASMMHGASSKSWFMWDWGMLDYKTNTVTGQGLRSIVNEVPARGGSMIEFSEYLSARALRNLQELGRNVPISNESIKSILDGPRAEVYKPIAAKLGAYNKGLLKYQLDAGLITKARYDKLNRDFKDSVPMDYLIEAFEPVLKEEAKAAADQMVKEILATGAESSKDKAAKLYVDPLESQVRMTMLVNRLVAQNDAKRTIANEFGVSSSSALSSGMTRLSYVNNGKSVVRAVPKVIYEAANNLSPDSLAIHNKAYNALAKTTGVFRVSTTGNITFAVKAATIDQFIAWIQTPKEIGFCPFIDMFRGATEIFTAKVRGKESAFTDWLKDGGANASVWSLTRDFSQEMIKECQVVPVQNMISSPGKYWKDILYLLSPLGLVKNAYKGVLGFTENVDAATRVGVYMKAMKAGYDPKEAAFISRRSTIDFNRAGATIRAVNGVIAFLNARIQGVSLAAEAFKTDPAGTMSKVIQGVVIPSALLAMVNNDIMRSDDPDLNDIRNALLERPAWRRVAYWAVPIPAIGAVLEIPKPYEFATAFATPVDAYINWLFDKDTFAGRSYFDTLADEGFWAGIKDTLIPNVIPTAFVAPTEVLTNYSFFTGNNIIPAYLSSAIPAMQYKPGTSTTARWISESISKIAPSTGGIIAPLQVDHLVRGWLGPVGQSLVSVLDTAIEAAGYDVPVKPEKQLADMPFFKTFVTKYPSANAYSISKFNDEARTLTQRYNSVVIAAKTGDPSARRIADNITSNVAFANMQGMFSAMSNMSRAVQMINIHNNDPVSKRQQIENIYIQMVQVAREGRKVIRQIKSEVENAGQ